MSRHIGTFKSPVVRCPKCYRFDIDQGDGWGSCPRCRSEWAEEPGDGLSDTALTAVATTKEGNALMADGNCCCTTAADLGFSGWGDGVNPNLIANEHPECPIHGVVPVPRDLWAKVRNIPSDRLPTGTWEAIQAIGRDR